VERADTPASAARAQALEAFAAEALDWPEVRRRLAAFTASPIGTRALGELAPREDEDARAALARAREMQVLLAEGSAPPLDGQADLRPALEGAANFRRALSGAELADLARFLRRAEDLGHWLAARRAEAPACGRLWSARADLAPLRARLESALDERGVVADTASDRLARLRADIARGTEEVERVLREVARRPEVRAILADGGRVQLRGGRRMLAVRARAEGRLDGVVHDRSQTGETLFVEPREAVARANRLFELEADERAEVQRILIELTREVLRLRPAIESDAARWGELELALVSARYARSIGGRPARLPGEEGAHPGLLLRGFRHPVLLAQAGGGQLEDANGVVPLDLRLGTDFDLLVITGPNTGGKTLALKSAGLAALMTRMGLALPCEEGTTVPLYGAILADIGDEQEIEQSLSTFSSHLVRIRAALERAGPDTLVLLDELGSGTDPMEGAALGEAILVECLARRAPTLATTHLGALKTVPFRHARAENAHVEFDLATLAPLFSLVIGAPGESRALAIARRLGLPPALVERARVLLDRPEGESDRLVEELRAMRLDTERLRASAEVRLVEAEARLGEIAAERAALSSRGERLEGEAQRLLEERLARARAAAERVRAFLPQIAGAARAELERLLDRLEEALGSALLTDRRRAFLAGLRKGSVVWLPRLQKRCEVLRVRKDERELELKLGQRTLTLGFDDVTYVEGA
jgi:DNA mismatch repair protein MutS2